MIGVDVVDMKLLRFRVRLARRRQGVERDTGLLRERDHRLPAIAASFCRPGDDATQHRADAGSVEPRQHGIDGGTDAVADDDHQDPFCRQRRWPV